MVPASVALLPLVSKAPPPALSVTARLVVNPERNCSVPPPKARPPAAPPRFALAATASTPPVDGGASRIGVVRRQDGGAGLDPHRSHASPAGNGRGKCVVRGG